MPHLLQSYSEGVRLVFGALALVLWVCLVLKAVFCWKGGCQAMGGQLHIADCHQRQQGDEAHKAKPERAGSHRAGHIKGRSSVAGTFPMATMLLAVYAKPFAGAAAAQIIWLLGTPAVWPAPRYTARWIPSA